jgi:hypothetical protein
MIYSLHNSDGKILYYVNYPDGVDPLAAIAGEVSGVVNGKWDAGLFYVQSGDVVPRPAITINQSAGGVTVSPCPVGAIVTVMDAETDVVFGEAEGAGDPLDIELPDAGEYIVKVEAIFPWLAPAALRVTV